MRKADPSSSRRTLRRRTQTPFPAAPAPASDLDRRGRKAGERSTESRLDSDFGICLCVVPALRRRSDA